MNVDTAQWEAITAERNRLQADVAAVIEGMTRLAEAIEMIVTGAPRPQPRRTGLRLVQGDKR